MTPSEYPNVVFVTPCAFNHVTGGGITFSNLFRGWPKEKLATVHRDRVPASTDVCSQYYELSRCELTPALPGSAGILSKGRLSTPLTQWLKTFSPQLIYTILGTTGYIDLVKAIHEQFHIPIAAHLMDEGVTDPKPQGLLSPWVRHLYGKAQRSLLQEADVRMGICDAMSRTYAQRYGLPFETFMNTADLSTYPPRKTTQSATPFRLAYTGSILPFAQEESLNDVALVVSALHKNGVPIRLDIYTPLSLASPSLDRMKNQGGVFIHDSIQDDQAYFDMLRAVDALVLPVNFDERSIHYIRYSMSTKIPSYLSSGTPILVYGPTEVAQVDYAEKSRWGKVVNQRSLGKLQEAIVDLKEDQVLRQSLSLAAASVARQNHDSAVVPERFQSLLARTAREARA